MPSVLLLISWREKTPDVVGGHRDRRAGQDQHCQRGLRRLEPPGGPDEHREDHVQDRDARRSCDRGDRHYGAEEQTALPGADAAERRERRARPDDHEGNDHECPREVSEPPRSQEGGALRQGDHSRPQHRERAGRGTDRRPERERAEHAGHLLDPVELRAAPDQSVHQGGADDDLGHVAELLPDERRRRQGVVAEQKLEVDDEVTEKDAGPPAQPPEIERCDAKAGRRPDCGDRSRVLEGLPGLRRRVVGGGEREDACGVARPAGACAGQPARRFPTGKGFDSGAHGGALSSRPKVKRTSGASQRQPWPNVSCRLGPLHDAAPTSVSDHHGGRQASAQSPHRLL